MRRSRTGRRRAGSRARRSMGQRRQITWDDDDVSSGYYQFFSKGSQRRVKRDVKRSTRRRERREGKRLSRP